MTVIIRYRFGNTDNRELKKVKEYLSQKGMDVNSNGEYFFAEEEVTYISEEPVEEFFLKTAREDCLKLAEILQSDFSLEGTIDTSYSAGEYMDFFIKYRGGRVTVKASDWYVEPDEDDSPIEVDLHEIDL